MESILGGSDNIFKYMASIGMLLIGIGILYPLEKQNDLELKTNTLLSQLKVDSLQNQFIINDISAARKQDERELPKLESLKEQIENSKNETERENLSNQLNIILDKKKEETKEFEKLTRAQLKNSIAFAYKKEEIRLLKEQSKTFGKYYKSCFCLGLPLTVLGFFFWLRQTIIRSSTKTQ